MLSDEQSKICEHILTWLSDFRKENVGFTKLNEVKINEIKNDYYVTVGGYAGTGKTYMISVFRKILTEVYGWNYNVAFCTLTGKASSVLQNKLRDSKIEVLNDYVGTIHGLMYRPVYEKNSKGEKVLIGFEKYDQIEDFDLIIIDEASMVNKNIWEDIIQYKIPIIAIGDHGQLPPVGDSYNLMTNPNFTLTEIHRQALESPIIRLSIEIRNGKYIPLGFFGSSDVFKLDWKDPRCQRVFSNIEWNNKVTAICSTNETRCRINQHVRDLNEFKLPEPYPGERLVCLLNNHSSKIYNGQTGTVLWIMPYQKDFSKLSISVDGFEDDIVYETLMHQCCLGKMKYDGMWDNVFQGKDNYKRNKILMKKSKIRNIDVFDFGYALTAHKSQGSEWDKVVFFEENVFDFQTRQRLIYTAITRAREKLFIIAGY